MLIPQLSKVTGKALRRALEQLGRSRLPQTDGRLYLPALKEQVIVTRDRSGIPTIGAENRHDLFVAQGFVHAQERLWQMEVHRRAATGTLSAVVGEAALQTDRLSRTLGFFRLAEETWQLASGMVRRDVQAYTAGVNAYLLNKLPLPIEFSLLRHRPEPWNHLDSVAFGRMMAWVLSHGFANKLTRARLIERVGARAAAELELFYPPENPETLPNGIEFNMLEGDGMLRAVEGPFINRGLHGVGRGSNGWVLSGHRTSTGKPLLCNDMHLPVTAPSLWYVNGLRCRLDAGHQALNVIGASLPGVPYVLVGHNDHIAWGATVSFLDSEDLFVERFSAADPELYEFEGQWRRAELFDERIPVRGRPDHHEQVIVTHHGPLISRVLASSGQALALASRALETNSSFDGFALLNSARDWNDFAAAVQKIDSPSLNLLYADDVGNIGYYVTGRAPIRLLGNGQVPVPGWTGEHEWVGDVPFAEMPHSLNPASGYLINANNRIVSDDYPYYLGNAWRNGYRARRIKEFIEKRDELSLQDMRRLQSDLQSLPGLELSEYLRTYFEVKMIDDADALVCLEILLDWNGLMAPNSQGALVYKTLVAELSLAILVPKLGRSLAELFLGAGPHPVLYPLGESHGQWIPVLLRLLRSENSAWLPKGTAKDEMLQQCLANTLHSLRARYGTDPSSWSWGAEHRIEFGHPLAAQRPLDTVFNVGPFIVGGDADTVCQMSVSQNNGTNNIAPSYRQLVDTGNWENSLAMHAPGQSGHLASPHYADLTQPWLDGTYYTLNWSISASDKSAVSRMQLLPWPDPALARDK